MFTIIYLCLHDGINGEHRLIAITVPNALTAWDVATCLRASGRCANVRVWHKGVSESF